MKLKYKLETDDFTFYANNLEDIACSMNIPIYTIKHKIKNNTLNIDKVDTTLKDVMQQNGSVSIDCYGIFNIKKHKKHNHNIDEHITDVI